MGCNNGCCTIDVPRTIVTEIKHCQIKPGTYHRRNDYRCSDFDAYYCKRRSVCNNIENTETYILKKKYKDTCTHYEVVMPRDKYYRLIKQIFSNREQNEWYIRFFQGNTFAQMPYIIKYILTDNQNPVVVDLSYENIRSVTDKCLAKTWSMTSYTKCIDMFIYKGIITSLGEGLFELTVDNFYDAMLFKYIDKLGEMYTK